MLLLLAEHNLVCCNASAVGDDAIKMITKTQVEFSVGHVD